MSTETRASRTIGERLRDAAKSWPYRGEHHDKDFSWAEWTDETIRLVTDSMAAQGLQVVDAPTLAVAMGSTGNCGHSSCPRDTSRHDDEAAAIIDALQRTVR